MIQKKDKNPQIRDNFRESFKESLKGTQVTQFTAQASDRVERGLSFNDPEERNT